MDYTLGCFERNEYSTTLFLDLSKAFDCVDHCLLLDKLKLYYFCENTISLIKSYLSNRYQFVRLQNSQSSNLLIKTGVPQGSILGPILYLIYVNKFPTAMRDTHLVLYADDTTLSFNASNIPDVLTKAEKSQATALDWFLSNKLCVNVGKTQRMVFSLRHIDNEQGQDEVRFLGISLDPKLDWHSHGCSVASKLVKNIYALRFLRNCLSTKVLKQTYFALCHSQLSYGILLWGHSSSRHRLFALQRRAIRLIAHVSYRSDCKPVFTNLKILTLPSLYILECILYVKKNPVLFPSQVSVHDHETRFCRDVCYHHYRLKKAQNGPNHLAIKFFNCIPLNIRLLDFSILKNRVKNYLIEKAFFDFDEFLNCDHLFL